MRKHPPSPPHSDRDENSQDDDKDENKKHLLSYKWRLWYNKPTSSWEPPRQVVDFDTVEDFWCVYNRLTPPGKLPKGSDYHVFKESIRPEWEDKENREGGKWLLTLKPDQVDKAWEEALLGIIGGEEFGDDSEKICGIVVSLRKQGNKLCLWMKRSDDETATRIGKAFKTIIGLGMDAVYSTHGTTSFRGPVVLTTADRVE